jgi:hypothetical protein
MTGTLCLLSHSPDIIDQKTGKEPKTMTDTIKPYLTKIQIGAEQSFKNLSIFPLLSDYFIPFDYLTIDDAVSKNLIEVMEIQQN